MAHSASYLQHILGIGYGYPYSPEHALDALGTEALPGYVLDAESRMSPNPYVRELMLAFVTNNADHRPIIDDVPKYSKHAAFQVEVFKVNLVAIVVLIGAVKTLSSQLPERCLVRPVFNEGASIAMQIDPFCAEEEDLSFSEHLASLVMRTIEIAENYCSPKAVDDLDMARDNFAKVVVQLKSRIRFHLDEATSACDKAGYRDEVQPLTLLALNELDKVGEHISRKPLMPFAPATPKTYQQFVEDLIAQSDPHYCNGRARKRLRLDKSGSYEPIF
ncbi:MAG: hypothetical protein S4CHLAM37_15360 [Chlamydiia bacterium]|nr:hypothetical protein [Chlamydiia bacterium]